MESFTCHFVRISSLCLFYLFIRLCLHFYGIMLWNTGIWMSWVPVEFHLRLRLRPFYFLRLPVPVFPHLLLGENVRLGGAGSEKEREKKKKRKSEGWSISLHGAVGNAYRVARDKWPPVNGIETLLYPREKTSRLLWKFYNFICRSTSGLTTVPPLLRRHSVIQWFCVSLPFLWRGVIGVDLCDQMLDLIALYIGRWGIYSFLQSPRWDWKFHDYFQ